MNPKTLQQPQIGFDELDFRELIAVCKTFTKAGIARAFDLPLKEVEKKYRFAIKELEHREQVKQSKTFTISKLLNRPEKSILEVAHEQCEFIKTHSLTSFNLTTRASCAANLRTLRDVAATQKEIDEALEKYLKNSRMVDVIIDPILKLPDEYKETVLKAWSDNAELRLMMR